MTQPSDAMLEALVRDIGDIPWSNVRDCFGFSSGTTVAKSVRDLLTKSDSDDDYMMAIDWLYSNALHQGDAYPILHRLIPLLVRALSIPARCRTFRFDMIEFLGHAARSRSQDDSAIRTREEISKHLRHLLGLPLRGRNRTGVLWLASAFPDLREPIGAALRKRFIERRCREVLFEPHRNHVGDNTWHCVSCHSERLLEAFMAQPPRSLPKARDKLVNLGEGVAPIERWNGVLRMLHDGCYRSALQECEALRNSMLAPELPLVEIEALAGLGRRREACAALRAFVTKWVEPSSAERVQLRAREDLIMVLSWFDDAEIDPLYRLVVEAPEY